MATENLTFLSSFQAVPCMRTHALSLNSIGLHNTDFLKDVWQQSIFKCAREYTVMRERESMERVFKRKRTLMKDKYSQQTYTNDGFGMEKSPLCCAQCNSWFSERLLGNKVLKGSQNIDPIK